MAQCDAFTSSTKDPTVLLREIAERPVYPSSANTPTHFSEIFLNGRLLYHHGISWSHGYKHGFVAGIDATVPFKSIHQVTWHRIQCVGISEALNADYLRWLLQNSFMQIPRLSVTSPDASKTSYIQMPLKGTNAVAIWAQGVDEESQVHDLPGASDRIQYASKRGWGHDHISFLLVELKGLLDSRAVHTVVVPGWIRCFCTSSKSVAKWASKVHQSLKFCVEWHVNIPCTSNVAKNDVCIGKFVCLYRCVKQDHRYNALTAKGETTCAQVEISECPWLECWNNIPEGARASSRHVHLRHLLQMLNRWKWSVRRIRLCNASSKSLFKIKILHCLCNLHSCLFLYI